VICEPCSTLDVTEHGHKDMFYCQAEMKPHRQTPAFGQHSLMVSAHTRLLCTGHPVTMGLGPLH